MENALTLGLRGTVISLTGLMAIASIFIHPYGEVKAAAAPADLLVGAQVDPGTAGILERSCGNCHSNKTEWPWYSYVAPASVLVESDVAKARSRMNFSHWSDYSTDEQQAMLL